MLNIIILEEMQKKHKYNTHTHRKKIYIQIYAQKMVETSAPRGLYVLTVTRSKLN